MENRRIRILLISIVPPHNDNGVRIVMYRHLIEREDFELHVASNADFSENLRIDTKLYLPWLLERIRKSRFGPRFRKILQDYANFIWTKQRFKILDECVKNFQPDLVLTLAETSLCHVAEKVARRNGLPLAVLFLDWFPIMTYYYGSKFTRNILSRRYRRLYDNCDLAICTSDGMKEELGPHSNSHVIYPMPGKHHNREIPPSGTKTKFKLVYVGSALGFYGRMLRSLLKAVDKETGLELIVVGPNEDWPRSEREEAERRGQCLGVLKPEDAAKELVKADAMLVVMSFEEEYELFMKTSFTTKFLDYASFHKPIIVWGPSYCTPMHVIRNHGGALPVTSRDPEEVIKVLGTLSADQQKRERYASEAKNLNRGIFNPDNLQKTFVSQINSLVKDRVKSN